MGNVLAGALRGLPGLGHPWGPGRGVGGSRAGSHRGVGKADQLAEVCFPTLQEGVHHRGVDGDRPAAVGADGEAGS